MLPPQGIAALLKEALVVYKGTTTSAGAADGSTLVCSALTSKADFDGNQIIVTSGDYDGQARDINGATTLGTVTVANVFSGQIPAGVSFVITGIRTVPAEVATLTSYVDYEGSTSLADKLTAARAGYLDVLNTDSKYINSTAVAVPTVNSLTKFIASGGTGLGTTLGASKSLVDAIGADGVDALSHDFSEGSVLGYAHGKHITTYILFVIPEAVASITATNTAIQDMLEQLGRVVTITQADALDYPEFTSFTFCVLGSNSGTAWTTSNLADIKNTPGLPIICCDSASAAYMEMGTANANVTNTKVLNGVANIEGSLLGTGIHDITGLAAGAQDIADSNTTFASLNMSDADITEVYYGYETSNDNAHVLLGMIHEIQPGADVGTDEEGAEVQATLAFYGPAYSYDSLNTLGQGVLEILCLGIIHSKTIGAPVQLSGSIRSLEKVLFGNLKNKFSNSNPLAKFIGTGGVGLGQPLPNSTSLVDIIGDFTGPHDGAEQDDNIKASLDLAHTDLDAIIVDIAALNNITAANVWETNISAYSGAGYAGTYLKTLYDDWLNGGRLDLILDSIEAEVNASALAQGAGSVASNAQVDSLVRAIADIVRSGGSGDLAAILADVTAINGDAMRGTDNAALAATALSNATWTDARAGYLDNINNANLATVPDISGINTVLGRQEHVSYFRSDMQASVTLDDTGTTDVSLPSVTIPSGGMPTGHTIDAVYCHFKYGSRKDTSASDNAINGDQYIQVKESAAGSYTNAVKIIDNGLPVDVSEATVMGGDVIFGNIEVSSQVAAENKTYNFQWLNCQVDGNNLILYDVQTIIEVRWH